MKPDLAAVLVLYNPEKEVVNNIHSFISQVDKIFVIDNSEKINIEIVNEIKQLAHIEYIPNNENLGIAASLNICARKAISEGYKYLLTMDQDSEAPPAMVSNLLECFSKDNNIALVSPHLQSPQGRNLIDARTKSCEQVFTTWTSGSLLDLNIFKSNSGFKADLFIDYVDHEYCLRLKKMGYKVYICNKTSLMHSLGKIEEVNLIFRKIYPTNHSALRLYYKTRNRYYVKKIYKKDFPDFFKQDNKDFWLTSLKTILFEKEKLKKVRFMLKGYNDFRRNIYGKYQGLLIVLIFGKIFILSI